MHHLIAQQMRRDVHVGEACSASVPDMAMFEDDIDRKNLVCYTAVRTYLGEQIYAYFGFTAELALRGKLGS